MHRCFDLSCLFPIPWTVVENEWSRPPSVPGLPNKNWNGPHLQCNFKQLQTPLVLAPAYPWGSMRGGRSAPVSLMLCQGVKWSGQRSRRHAHEDPQLPSAPHPRLIARRNPPRRWNHTFLWIIGACRSVAGGARLRRQGLWLWHSPANNLWAHQRPQQQQQQQLHSQRNKRGKRCSLTDDYNNLHFFYTKACDKIKRSLFLFPRVQQANTSLPLCDKQWGFVISSLLM